MRPGCIVFKVPQQRPDIRPNAAGPQTVLYRFNVPDGIRCCVEEEDGCDSVKFVFVVDVGVEGNEVGGTHRHFTLLRYGMDESLV